MKGEANLEQYIVSFILLNICFICAFFFRKNEKASGISWLFALLTCLFAYWDSDYFGLQDSFSELAAGYSDNFKDPFYIWLAQLSFGNYTMFRFIIWGMALYMFKRTCNIYNIPSGMSAFVFVIFFLTTFAYARASLGMASYFFGISIILYKQHNFYNILKGLFFLLISILFHRSMAFLVVLSPLVLFRLNKKTVLIVLLLLPFAIVALRNAISDFFDGFQVFGSSEMFANISESAQKYASITDEVEMNWKFALVRYLRISSFFIVFAYIAYKDMCRKGCLGKSDNLVMPMFFISILSLMLLLCDSLGTMIVGYRILFMTGLPLCICLTTLYCQKMISLRGLILLVMPSVLSSEGFIFGKILANI